MPPSSDYVVINSPPLNVDTTEKSSRNSVPKVLDLDLSHSIRGLYRILDLISEQGSGGGLVDKIIISQGSLQAFANDVQPGAYTSLTKVDFKLLDKVLVSPVGIYGDKKSIVELLGRLGVVEKETYAEDERGRGSPSLRSGLYVLRAPPSETEGSRVYVIHWPEDTTWNDDAISSVRRNRVTFMRYLSKICDQTMALMSADYAQSIVWKESEDDDTYVESDDEGPERMYAFEVCKTNEQEESVTVRPGFTTSAPMIAPAERRLDKAPEEAVPMQPRLIRGETTQGLITAGYRAAIKKVEHFKDRPINKAVLENYLCVPISFCAHPTIEILMDTGLRSRCEQLCRKFSSERSELRQGLDSDIAQRRADSLAKLKQDLPLLTTSFLKFIIADLDGLANNPKIKGLIDRARDEQPLRTVPGSFHSSKERILIIKHLLDSHNGHLDEKTQTKLVAMIDNIKDIRKEWTGMSKGLRPGDSSHGYMTRLRSGLKSLLPHESNRTGEKAYKDALDISQRTSISQFISRANDIASQWPVLERAVNGSMAVVYDHFAKNLGRLSNQYAHEALRIQEEDTTQQLDRERSSRADQTQRDLCFDFARKLNEHFSNVSSRRELHVSSVRKTGYWAPYSPTLSVKGRLITKEDDQVVYQAHLMQLTIEDCHELQLDSSFVPSPRFGVAYTFSLPTGSEIIYSQLLEDDQLLLLTSDRRGNILVYRESLDALEGAIAHERYKTKLSRDKVGDDILIAFNEGKHMLAVLYTSPDGSCFLVSCSQDSSFSVMAYHWITFGSSDGTKLAIDDLGSEDDIMMTSFGSRNSVHLMKLDANSQTCKSFALDITRKSTEFMFKEKGVKSAPSADKSGSTLHNCLIDCHSEVWTRFPVLPAIQRQAITTSSTRCPKSLTFVSDFGQKRVSPHFGELIQTFERTARKITGNELRCITINAMTFNDFYASLDASSTSHSISHFRAGEWLVELLCLIPIHLAITKDNRFIPLKDGVFSPELEKSLLGAEVGRIVDSLSFGWYESIFQSYMASKPVKVVSSMGEQSVGKSFALNHFADTSFAGSAMRTTEGVWMSVTPTEDTLIVALDFEGVHSIERSAQEDTLLVLFNTAISNLVLFRNNFTLSRDITGLFKSFQSSSTVLDPAANPMLFQSTLVIIIKDVVDADAQEIKKEFSLKFHRIVQDEQESNFISRLHGGKLEIIPWPVIESKEFYKLFPRLKKRLDQQKVTHPAAGQFLHTVKTLMAKLKSNDWGALSHTMAAHRALQLHNMLPNALESGFVVNGIEREPLKARFACLCHHPHTDEPHQNLDTDEFVNANDTASVFAVGPSGTDREARLVALEQSWDQFSTRQQVTDETWFEGLASHVDHLLTLRFNRVGEWISSNLVRFQAVSHESIEDLKRTFESTTVDMRSNVQLCGAQCASCHLRCIQSRLHQGQHDCKTDHTCSHDCDFCEEDIKLCGMK
ncbi:hypothetical protein CONPUDRAFT_55755 [Coniophora puteana RWD-64-598 SS2]|uniref:Guanylate-binding protein N-terminal domain-containing protein n=1 Tax=Coniophora puteana (strain RWD-64-598) TaxID=741705 RepID=A0A5M3MQB6_CONPW|nr:uncharacterized protein CONPUDRAFT_55755 [Coniophora puteana RWD-64-598 SS2]EIW81353.1 hypothetical protein CONPUDRAFT_55755 [Coniophora puteana RWD-64-598 SS2]